MYEAVRAQFRRQRRDAEYRPTDAPELTPDDVREDLEKAIAIVDMAARLLDETAPY